MVDSTAGSENDSGKIGNIYFLLTEIFCGKTFNLDKRTENYLYSIFLCNIEVRRLLGSRLRLGNEYLLKFHCGYFYASQEAVPTLK